MGCILGQSHTGNVKLKKYIYKRIAQDRAMQNVWDKKEMKSRGEGRKGKT